MPICQLIPEIPNHSSIKNIIFDFGGVICDLDIPRTEEKFKAFGPARKKNNDGTPYVAEKFSTLVEKIETGRISPQEFRDAIRYHYETPPSDQAIDEAWNAMLLGIPERRIRLLEKLKDHYRIFLLSNSNKIHHEKYVKDFQRQTGYRSFNDLFEKTWFSFVIGLNKPGKEIFEFVLSESKLDPTETLFIDDMSENVEGAIAVGIIGYLLNSGVDVCELFDIQEIGNREE